MAFVVKRFRFWSGDEGILAEIFKRFLVVISYVVSSCTF